MFTVVTVLVLIFVASLAILDTERDSPDATIQTFGDALWTNIVKLFTQVDVPRIFGNSALIAIVGTTLTLTVSSLAGYGFEMFRSRFREKIFGLMLLMLSIPFAALMVPLFIMMANLKLINTYTAIILPTIASIFMIFYFRANRTAES